MIALPTLLGFGIPLLVFVLFGLFLALKSFHRIGPLEVGLVRKNWAATRNSIEDCPIAFKGEAGYQAELLQPGIRFRPWPLFSVTRHPWVQIPTDSVGVVVAQIGKALPQGRKTAVYKKEFGDFVDAHAFLSNGGEKGIQRPVLQPGTVVPLHPIAFLVLSSRCIYGIPIDDANDKKKHSSLMNFGVTSDDLKLVRVDKIEIQEGKDAYEYDAVGVVTVLDGDPLEPGQIACRLGGWSDIEKMLSKTDSNSKNNADIIEHLLQSGSVSHNNYQDMQAFFDAGGRLGLQHDVLVAGQYALNPFLVKVELEEMLEVQQGEVAVVKAFVGLRAVDESGDDFKHGQIVRPGRRGVWLDPLRTGKFAINPRLYEVEIVPTAILTLNWSKRTGDHGLDADLEPINAKSREGFNFALDLQVQIHVADKNAPLVISSVGSMNKLVHEVMRPAVGNFFRNNLGSTSATTFIETREQVQAAANEYVTKALHTYNVEVKGVFIQEVQLPAELVQVLTEREIADQQKTTLIKQRAAQTERAEFEKARGTADVQHRLAQASIHVEIARNEALSVKETAQGDAERIRLIGSAEASTIAAIGKAQGEAYQAQVNAIGAQATAVMNVAAAVKDGNVKIVPDILVMGGNNSSADGLMATLMGTLRPNDAKPAVIEHKAPIAQANGNATSPIATAG